MNSSSRTLVRSVLAAHLEIAPSSLADSDRFEDLGLDDLDLVLVVLRIEDLDRCEACGEFPIEALESARTVADLVALVDVWLSRTPRARCA